MSGKRRKKFQSTLQSRLLHEMREGAFHGAKYLPSENDLAKRMDVSRTQLRDALARLEREGVEDVQQALISALSSQTASQQFETLSPKRRRQAAHRRAVWPGAVARVAGWPGAAAGAVAGRRHHPAAC